MAALGYTVEMGRPRRTSVGGYVYHVLNRGNGRLPVFHKDFDYEAFLHVLAETQQRVPGMRLLAYCLMPNHYHLLLETPTADMSVGMTDDGGSGVQGPSQTNLVLTLVQLGKNISGTVKIDNVALTTTKAVITASELVSSMPRFPGVIRPQMKRSCGQRKRVTGRPAKRRLRRRA